jgi:type I restriction enzyme S subunit
VSFQLVKLDQFLTHRAEFVEIDDTRAYKRLRVQLHGQGIVLRDEVDGSQVKTKKQQLVRTGDFVVAEIDAKLGGFGIASEEVAGGIVSSHYFLFDIDESICLRGWLEAVIQSGRLEEQVTARGTTNYAAIRPDSVLNFEIPLPPLPEQRRIVERLAVLDEKLAQVTKLHLDALGRSARITSSVALHLLSRRGEPWKTLGDGILSMTNGLSRRPDGTEEGPPVLRLADVAAGIVDLNQIRRHVLSEGEKRNYGLEPGDLLFVRVNGSRQIVGRSIPFLGARETVCFNDHLIRVRVDPEIWDWRYINEVANSPLARSHFETVAITTAGQHTINHAMLSAMPVPPTSLAEQAAIAERLVSVRERVANVVGVQNRAIAEANALLDSVISQAFTGGL